MPVWMQQNWNDLSRDLSHQIKTLNVFYIQNAKFKLTKKYNKICAQFWEGGHGVCFVQLDARISHYKPMAREFTMIKAIWVAMMLFCPCVQI